MKISYRWIREYLDIDLPPEKVSELLTDCGLEVEGMEKFETLKGGLRGVIIGEVLTCVKHPNADKLSLTTVNTGSGSPLGIVCGAPNVAAGQKVLVATVGTILYKAEESFEIKKATIRGSNSEGMICAEDELGIGTDHSGIIVLPQDVKIGTPASEYFNIYEDVVFEIGLTPNRADATSHFGVARDLAAVLSNMLLQEPGETNNDYVPHKPSVESFKVDNHDLEISVVLEDAQGSPRYTGLTMTGIRVGESPDWMKNYLKAVGLRPINNIVDITNFILMESGQPLHAFDASRIKGNKVIVKTLPKDTKFVTLDKIERRLSGHDLMICNAEEGMCIAGVYGGAESGVTEQTSSIFLECAYFNPVYIRRTSKFHGLKTDSSFRFERGTDPENMIWVIKRAALLIKEIAGGSISSEIVDIYPEPIQRPVLELHFEKVNRLIGKEIDRAIVVNIIKSLGIEVTAEHFDRVEISIPLFKVDVIREADVIEEILRIYGYNNIEVTEEIKYTSINSPKPDKERIRNLISDLLSSRGFSEIMCNSLTRTDYMKLLPSMDGGQYVRILNPLSRDLEIMRPNLLFGALETILYNQNRKNANIRFYELGSAYSVDQAADSAGDSVAKYKEEEQLSLALAGMQDSGTWYAAEKPVDFFLLKAYVHQILHRLGVNISGLGVLNLENDIYSYGLRYLHKRSGTIVEFGIVREQLLKAFDIKTSVYYASFSFGNLVNIHSYGELIFNELPRFPEVRRDLALLIDKDIPFAKIEGIALKNGSKLLKSLNLFDVYEGKGIPDGKKSYAVSIILQDENKTMKDEEIDQVVEGLVRAYNKELGASIR